MQKNKLKNPNKSHPGIAGRKPKLINPSAPQVYLDELTILFYKSLGDGNLSDGIRIGRSLLEAVHNGRLAIEKKKLIKTEEK